MDISEESIQNGTPSIYIQKELQRVSRAAFDALDHKDVILRFPESSSRTKTCLILKTPKTESSIRKVFLPVSVAEMLIEHRRKQDEEKEVLGREYQDYNLVICNSFGTPREQKSIEEALTRLIKEHDLPPIVFHSIRHASITYKLKLNGGDVKAVQGDSGHAQSTMVTDVYSHILDENRKVNAELFEKAFYSGKGTEPLPDLSQEAPQGAETATLLKLLSNPETTALLKQLLTAMESNKE